MEKLWIWPLLPAFALLSFYTLPDSPTNMNSEPVKLISKIDLKELTGSEWWNEVRLGDLTGDNRLDLVVAAQRPGDMQSVGTLYAMDIEGNILWKFGQQNEEHEAIYHDMPLQIHDLSGDGNPEVIYKTAQLYPLYRHALNVYQP